MNEPASGFWRLAGVVADFGSPFYAEERQRDVWNEASALGLQLFLWGSTVLAGVMTWTGGRTQVPYAAALLALTGVISVLVLAYARRLGVEVPRGRALVGARLAVFTVLYLMVLSGFVRAMAVSLDSGTRAGLLIGLLVGAVGAVGVLVLLARRARLRAGRERDGEELPGA